MESKKISLLLLITWVVGTAFGQNQNSWINYNQSYFKFKIAENGMYRITRSELSAAGVPIASIDPRRIQLFTNGIEQAIFIEGQDDASFDANDFIEFYGKRNDGVADRRLYRNPTDQPHQFHSLFSDSSAYFLTWQLSNVAGKRRTRIQDTNILNLTPQQFHQEEQLLLYTSQYHEGRSYAPNDEIVISDYDNAEGWTGNAFSTGQSTTINFSNLVNTASTFGKPNVEILLAGRNNNAHSITVSVGSSATTLRSIGTASWSKDDMQLFRGVVEWSDLGSNGELVMRVTANGVNNAADRVSVSYAKLNYPQNWNAANVVSKTFYLPETSANRALVQISNAPTAAQLFDITDTNNLLAIATSVQGGGLTSIVPTNGSRRTLLLTSDYKKIGKIQPVSFKAINSNANYIIITHPSLRSGSGVNADPIQAYADYRASTAGGAFRVAQIEIDEVYDQFGYGIPTVAAIRDLARFFLASGTPSHIFIIGKGVSVNFNYYRQNPTTTSLVNFVPTYGYPGGDEPFTAGLRGESYVPTISTGRLNVRNAKQVQDYLAKVKEMEALPYNATWRKDIIHLSGGATISEQRTIKGYMEEFERIATGQFLGGDVSTQFKVTTDAVEFFDIASQVNSGKSLITFFGHSGTFAADIDIGFASDPGFGYTNKGKYPVILVNGCNAGDLYSTVSGFGEDWVHTADKGAIAFMAHSKQAFSNTLRLYTRLFYEIAFASDTYFGTSLGQIRAELARQYFARFGTSESSISQVEQFVLLGDPAVKVFGATLTDYAVDGLEINAVTLDGGTLAGNEDAFFLNLPVANFGRFNNDSIEVSVTRTLANGTIQSLGVQKFAPISREGIIKYLVRNDPETTNTGNNTFRIVLDPSNKLSELDKNNNIADFEVLIAANATVNLYPFNFGIVSNKNVTFIVQSTTTNAVQNTFTIEVDTTSNFNSGFLKRQSKQAGMLAKFDLNLSSLKDSTVVYWRSKIEELAGDNIAKVSSFSLIPNINAGFAIRHENQYPFLEKDKITRNTALGRWEFVPTTADIRLQTFGSKAGGSIPADVQVIYNGLNYNVNSAPIDPGCRNNTINLVAFSRESTVPYKVIEYNALDVLNALVCGRVPQIIYNFTPGDIAGGSRHMNSFLNAAKTDDNILVFTIGEVNFENFDSSIKDALAAIGMNFSQIASIKNGNPFIILGKKGAAAGSARLILNNNSSLPENEQFLTLESEIEGIGTRGSLKSPLIGPAKSWNNFLGNVSTNDRFRVIGVTPNGNEEIIHQGSLPRNFNLSFISSERYPNIRINVDLENTSTFLPANIKSWHVFYQPLPEGVLFKDKLTPITIPSGADQSTDFYFWNVSNTDYSDSLSVTINSRNSTTKELTTNRYNIPAINGGDSTILKVPLKGVENLGKNSLFVSVLPKSDQEFYLPNNRVSLPDYYDVVDDDRNPILDVAFDGAYIMNGDIVSPNPLITILVKDDNPIVLKKDTLGVNIQLKRPCSGCGFERISLSSPEVNWQPATVDRDFKVDFSPTNLENGIYELRVQATDASGNSAGSQPYQVSFEVINESTITNFYPYPNPFSSSTRFVFTLTGNNIPDQIKIQILTVSGRVVREITQDELGTVRIGNNISEYAWNGTDEFGDQLANGVYLYRVITKYNGQDLQMRATDGDRAFNKGFGKLYILR